MNDWLHFLSLLNVPVFVMVAKLYVKNEVRLAKLEEFRRRVEDHQGWNTDRRGEA